MGMDISSRLMYGRYYRELVEQMTDEQVEKLDEGLDDGVIEGARIVTRKEKRCSM